MRSGVARSLEDSPHGHLYVQVPGIRNKIAPFLYIAPSLCQKINSSFVKREVKNSLHMFP